MTNYSWIRPAPKVIDHHVGEHQKPRTVQKIFKICVLYIMLETK